HLRVGLPDLLELLDGEARRPVVLLVDDDRERVVRNLELDVLDALGHARLLLLLLDWARGVGDVGLAGAEALEAAAGAGDPDRHLDAAVLLLELLGGTGDERADR